MNKLIVTVLLGLTGFSANAVQLTTGEYQTFCNLVGVQTAEAYEDRMLGFSKVEQLARNKFLLSKMKGDTSSISRAIELGTLSAFLPKPTDDYVNLKAIAKRYGEVAQLTCLETLINTDGEI